MEDPRIIELIGEASYEDLINAIEGIWHLDTKSCIIIFLTATHNYEEVPTWFTKEVELMRLY
jgi:hypothetical protein